MAHYLVTARPLEEKLDELEERLRSDDFAAMEPFGRALTKSLRNARCRPDGRAVWEEEDYCVPPLREEREAVLDDYFEDLEVEAVSPGQGWKQIDELPVLFAEFE